MRSPLVFPACLVALFCWEISVQAQITILVAADTANTGQNSSGGLIAAGQADPTWDFVGYNNAYGFNNIMYAPETAGTTPNPVPSPNTITTGATEPVSVESSFVVQNPPGAWAPATGNTEYVSANPDQSKGGMPGVYMYQYTLPVGQANGTMLQFSGVASADNGLAIIYNGVTEATFGGQLVLSTTPGWTSTTNANTPPGGSVYAAGAAPFSFTITVAGGDNSLDFDVSNFNDAAYSGDEEGLYVTNFQVAIVPEPRDYALYLLAGAMGLVLVQRMRRQFAFRTQSIQS